MPNPENGVQLSVLLDGKGKKPFAIDAPINAAAPFQSAVFGHLLYTDESYDLKPGLLESWEWDFKNHWYTLVLKKNLKFHNGRPVTAKDLEFALTRGFFSINKSFYAVTLGNIAGVDEIKPGSKFQSGKVKGIKVVDTYKLRVTLKYPNPSFLHNLSYPYFSVVPQEALESDYFTWKSLPVGAGTYKVIWSDPGSTRVRLQNVDDIGKSAPRIFEISTDGSPKDYDLVVWANQALENSNYEKFLSPVSNSVTVIIFNFQNLLGQDVSFRRSISLALDRAALTQQGDSILPSFELLPKHFWGRFGAKGEFDPGKSKQLVQSLSKKIGQTSKEGILVRVRSSEISDSMCQLLKSQLESVGIKTNMVRDNVKLWEKTDKEASMAIVSIAMPDVDPLLEFAMFKTDSPLFPFVPFQDKKFTQLYWDASKNSSLDIRVDTVKKLSQYFIEKQIGVPLFERKPTVYFRKDKVKSLGEQDGRLSFYFDHVELK